MYIFAKRIFRRTAWAAAAAGLLAADFLLFTLARIATIDSFSLLFILMMYFFMYEYTQMSFLREPLGRTLLPLGLPTGTVFSASQLAQAALRDKKRGGDHITLVLPQRIGCCTLHRLPLAQLTDFFALGLEE